MDLIVVVAMSTPSLVLRYATAFFLVVVAVAMAYALVRTGQTLARVEKMIEDVDKEIVPILGKAGTTLDEVNAELHQVGEITTSVADMTQKIDAMTRAVESAVSLPARKAAAFGAGVSQAVSSFIKRGGEGTEGTDS
jgi:uncharacterized protein YoxC